MQLGSLIKQIRCNDNVIRHPSNVYSLETSKGIFRTGQDLYSDESYLYYVLLVDLFDRAILSDDLHTLSIEQQKLLEHYFRQGNPHSKRWNALTDEQIIDFEVDENIYNNEIQTTPENIYDFYLFNSLSKHIKTLDEFLGSYIGEDDGEYSRYSKEQLYCECQPFSTKINTTHRNK